MNTIEEKARAYDEAIKKAAALYKASEPMSGCNVIIETLFPELKESEDEKVRKELIKHLKELSDWKEDEVIPVKNQSYYRQWASWLEKQGEQEKDILEDAILDGNEDGLIAETIRYKHENQAGQKPNDKVEQRFKVKYAGSEYNVLEVKDIAGVTFYGIEDEPNHIDYVKEENCEIISGYAIKENGSPYPTKPAVFSEKKPAAWSEEDEELLKWSINNLTELKDRFGEEYGKVGKCIDWVKSLKGRVQPKQEWSEEDEQILQGIWDEILANKHDAKECEWKTYDKFLDWLKSLRPQNHWKPSDGDIIILEKVIKGELEPKIFQATLQGILEQLKKL